MMDSPPVVDIEPQARTNTFTSQLRFWGIHCSLTALPSFCIALMRFQGLPAIAAMLCGVATFVLVFTYITSTSLYGKVHSGLIGRSIKLGARIRMIVSMGSLPLLLPLIGYNFSSSGSPPISTLFAPDFWFGYAAIMLSFLALNAILPHGFNRLDRAENFGQEFLFPYVTTLVEGILISVSLIFIAFITLIILNFRRNRRQMPTQYIPQPPGGQV